MKVSRTKTEFEEVDIKLPFFAVVYDEYESRYVKITKDKFILIKSTLSGYELFQSINHSPDIIPEVWYDCQCDEIEFIQALNDFKNTLNNV